MKHLVLVIMLSVAFAAKAVLPADSTFNWRFVANAAGAAAVNGVFTEALKGCVNEMRPNGEDNHSFPSRHTSYSFMASTVLAANTYREFPWSPLVLQAAASGVGLQRIGSRAHWASDVVAGAGIGILSAEVANIVCRRIFGGTNPYNSRLDNDFRPSLAVISRAVYHLGGGRPTGFATALDFGMPLSGRWGVAVRAEGEASPVKLAGRYYAPLWTFTALAGPKLHLPAALRPIAAELTLAVGASRYCKAPLWRSRTWTFAAGLSAGLSWRLTDAFAARLAADYRRTGPDSAVGISAASVLLF